MVVEFAEAMEREETLVAAACNLPNRRIKGMARETSPLRLQAELLFSAFSPTV
jgi:hypothetical protein